MRLPRFRIRTIMLAVAAIAIAIAGYMAFETMAKQRAYYLWRARLCQAEWWLAGPAADDPIPSAEAIAYVGQKREQIKRKQQKYEHAARYPWLSVAPDPSEPE